MTAGTFTLPAKYSLARLDGNRMLRLLDIAAERYDRSPLFWNWLRVEIANEQARRATFGHPAVVPVEAGMLDLAPMRYWESHELADTLRTVVALNESLDDLELSLLFSKLTLTVVGIVCHRLRSEEAYCHDESALDSDSWGSV